MNGAFEGVHGAISLSIIAFSIVFLVLLGLTAVIYAIRFFANIINQRNQKKVTTPKKASGNTPVKTAVTSSSATAGTAEEVVAAITGALIAKMGKGFRIVNIKAKSVDLANDPWKGWGKMEAMEGMDCSNWNSGTWN